MESQPEEEIIIRAPLVYAYAGFWRRFAAYLVDGLVLGVVAAVIGFGVGFAWFMLVGQDELSQNIFSAILNAAMFIIAWFYFAGQESSESKATLGKRLLGIFVTDMQGEQLSFGRASGRYFGKVLSGITIIGYLLPAMTARKQALHDLIAKTLVIHAHA